METDRRPGTFPGTVEDCIRVIEQLEQRIQGLELLNGKQQHMLEQLRRSLYGQKADRFHPDQLVLSIFRAIAEKPSRPRTDGSGTKGATKRRQGPGHGRRLLPANLPRRRVVHDIPEDKKHCDGCGTEKVCIGEETSEQLEYEPASFYVVEHVRLKYACRPCGNGVVTAPKPPQPIEKGLAGPGLLAHVVTSKYADHSPLNRQEGIYRRHGVEISRKTMCGWMAAMAKHLRALYDEMKERVLSSRILWTDDTPVDVQDPERTKTREGRIWVYVGDDKNPYTVYDYTPTRSREGPGEFLKGYRGYLQADAYPGYDKIYASGEIVEVACMAHVRRRYVDAQPSDPVRAIIAGMWIHQLYQVEQEARDRKLDSSQRCALRQEKAKPILARMKAWLLTEQTSVLPKSPIGEAISYTISNWEALERYTEDGDLAIDNNIAEGRLRGLKLGLSNWTFFGSDNGGQTGAILLSLIATCKAHGVDPFAYLRDVIGRMVTHPRDRVAELLPDNWKTAQPKVA